MRVRQVQSADLLALYWMFLFKIMFILSIVLIMLVRFFRFLQAFKNRFLFWHNKGNILKIKHPHNVLLSFKKRFYFHKHRAYTIHIAHKYEKEILFCIFQLVVNTQLLSINIWLTQDNGYVSDLNFC